MTKGKNRLLAGVICLTLIFADIAYMDLQVVASEPESIEYDIEAAVSESENDGVKEEETEVELEEEKSNIDAEEEHPQETESEAEDTEETSKGVEDGADAAENDIQDTESETGNVEDILQEQEDATGEIKDVDETEEDSISVMSTDSDFQFVMNSSSTWYILKSYKGSDPIINIPDSWNEKYVCEIADGAFVNYSGQHKATVCIPAHMTTISNRAFGACSNIIEIYVDPANTTFSSQDGVLYFHNCLTRCPEGKSGGVNIPEGVEEIGENAFLGCANLASVSIPQSVSVIKSGAFSNCTRLTDIYYSGSVEQWEKLNVASLKESTKIHYGFQQSDYQYTVLKGGTVEITGYNGTNNNIQIPEWLDGKRVTSIADGAFLNSSSVGMCINIPESITNIGIDAFEGCAQLKYIYYAGSEEQWEQVIVGTPINAEIVCHCVPDRYTYTDVEGGVEIIGYTGEDLDITIPGYIDEKRVVSIGKEAFYESGLYSVCIPQGVTCISQQAFAACKNLKKVDIPDGITSIGKYAFAVCSSLESVSIPESVTNIGEFAFNECSSLNWIDLPKSVTAIKKSTFDQCGSLKYVYFSGSRKQWDGVEIAGNNDALLSAEIHFADDTEEEYYDCRVSFNAWGVADIPDQVVKEYSLLARPQDPIRSEYSFLGWYHGDKKWDFDYNKVYDNMILDARWEAEEKVSVEANGKRLDKEGYEIWENGSTSLFYSAPAYKGSSSGGYAQNSTTWSVNNPNVVTISDTSGDSIQVTAVSQGTAIVTERTVSKYYLNNALTGKIELWDTQITSTTKKLRVVDQVSSIKMITALELELNQSVPIEYSTVPAGNYARYVSGFRFISSDKDVVAVSQDGIVTAKGSGTARVTAYTINSYGDIVCQADCTVTVKSAEESGSESEITYKVDFELNGHGAILEEYLGYNRIKQGSKIQKPTEPEDSDFNFTGWYREAECIVLWDFDADTVESDMILYAGWIEKTSDDKEEGDDKDDEESSFGDILPEDVPSDGVIPDGIWSAGITDQVYTAVNINQVFRIYDGTTRLKEKIDYTVLYKNHKSAYTYTDQDYVEFEKNLQDSGKRKKIGSFDPNKAPQVIVKMKGNYTGNKIIYFRILQADISGDDFSAADLAATYSGKKQTPLPILMWNGKALKYGRDFFVPEYDSAKNNKKAFTEKGKTYDLTITGKNNFTGEIPVKLTISEGDSQIALQDVTVKGMGNHPWTGQQIRPDGYTVKYKNKILSEEEFTVSYGANTDVGIGTVTFTGTGEDKDGDGYSCIGTKTVSFKITGTIMSKVAISGIEKCYTYSGEEIEPEAVLTYKVNKDAAAVTLVKEQHYTVSYQGNRNKGIATIIFTGLESGGYTGTKKYTFKIAASRFDDEAANGFNVTFKNVENMQNGIYTAPYMKGGAKPEIIVMAHGKTLKIGKDYTISYVNNKKVARYTDMNAPALLIRGKGNYAGSQKIYFTIAAKTLSNENGITVVANDRVESAKKNGYRQAFKVYDADGTVLSGNDCDFSHAIYTLVGAEEAVLDKESVVPAGSVVQISVQGKGVYAGGTATGTYRILKAGCDISKATIHLNDQIYTGRAVMITDQSQFKTGKVYMKNGKETKVLTLGKEIEVVDGSYGNNINKGKAKVTFRGINEYGGTKTVTYRIGVRSILDYWKGSFVCY